MVPKYNGIIVCKFEGAREIFLGGVEMENSERNFVKIIKEICEEENIQIESFSYDWIFKLHKNGVYNYILGYQFGLNTCSVHSICCDKSAASEVMSALNIPNIEHIFFMSPTNQKYVGKNGNWLAMTELLNTYGKLVCKSNNGTGGNSVYCVSNQYELENAAFKVQRSSRAMAISPYYDIENEYRTIVLNGEIKLVYVKQRPYIIGDGIHSIANLVCKEIENGKSVKLDEMEQKDFYKILDENEIFYLGWKHNLGKGSYAVIEDSDIVIRNIQEIVYNVVEKMNIRFASIDIVKCNGEYKVLEINSGVMMEHFSQQDDNTYKIAKNIYREAILEMMQ